MAVAAAEAIINPRRLNNNSIEPNILIVIVMVVVSVMVYKLTNPTRQRNGVTRNSTGDYNCGRRTA
eukprot:10914875-Heterocapsa_arctica.AAC.1